jgi:putative ATP-dependent endonuclease of OLD family
MAFFLALRDDQEAVPFQQAGTGTLNTLVLALLSFIAELKPDCVIFAMEEPEIAVQPHTQRRIAEYLLNHTTQTFVTSHSPYVIERFTANNTYLLTRVAGAPLQATCVVDATGLKENDYKRYVRRGLAECMLGQGAILVEGVTESHALTALARRMEEQDGTLNPLDLAGVTVFDAESDGQIPKFATFFQALGIKTFGFYDFKKRTTAEKAKFSSSLDVDEEHPYKGFEALIANEVPAPRIRAFLQELLDNGLDTTQYKVPAILPTDDAAIQKLCIALLSSAKGAGWATRLLEGSKPNELPATAVGFLNKVYGYFPPPAPKPSAATQTNTP